MHSEIGEFVYNANAARVVFGAGASAEAGEHLKQLGVTRAFVVCDRFVTESGLSERLEESLRAAGVDVVERSCYRKLLTWIDRSRAQAPTAQPQRQQRRRAAKQTSV